MSAPYYPSFIPNASAQYCPKTGEGTFLAQPREPPAAFAEISNLNTPVELNRVAAGKPLPTTIVKAIDAANRVGIGATSYVHYFLDGTVRENEFIREISTHPGHLSDREALAEVRRHATNQYHLTQQAQSCALDALGCLVAVDTNLALQRRDALLQHLEPPFQQFAPQLRAEGFMSTDLLPATAAVLASTDTNAYLQRQLIKSVNISAERAVTRPQTPKRKGPTTTTPKRAGKQQQRSSSNRTPTRQDHRRFQSNDDSSRTGGSSGGRGARQGNTTPNRAGGKSRGAKSPRGGNKDWRKPSQAKAKSKSPSSGAKGNNKK